MLFWEREREREREIILLHLVFFPENNKSLQFVNVSKLLNDLISCIMWLPCVCYISVYFFVSHKSWNSCIFPIYFVCNSLYICVYISIFIILIWSWQELIAIIHTSVYIYERKYKHEEGMTQENEMHLVREKERKGMGIRVHKK